MELIIKIYHWRKQLLLTFLISIILSVIAVSLLSTKYKAAAIIFPTRQFSVAKVLIEKNTGRQEDYLQFGDDEDVEKLMQLLNTHIIREKVADQFDLWNNWSIDKGNKLSNFYLKLKWENFVSYSITDQLSIKITVHDYVATRAAKIANTIANYADTVKLNMVKNNTDIAYKIVKSEHNQVIITLNKLSDSLSKMQTQSGIVDYKYEVKAYTKEIAKAYASGNYSAIKNLETQQKKLIIYGSKIEQLTEVIKQYTTKHIVLKQKLDDAIVNLKTQLPAKFIVDEAIPIEEGARPNRSLIVLVVVFSSLLLTYVYLSFKEKLRLYKSLLK